MRGFNPVLARHVMVVYSDAEIDLHAFVVPAANVSGQLQASITGCTALVGNCLWMDVMQKKETSARVGNATVAIRHGCSHREIIQPRCMKQWPRRPGELPGMVAVHTSHAERCTQQHAARLFCCSVTNVSYRRHAKASLCIRVIADPAKCFWPK